MSSRLAPAAVLIVLGTAILGTLALGLAAPPAFAKDGSGGGGSGGGGSSGGGSGGGGSGSGHGGSSGSSGSSGQGGSGNSASAGHGAEAGSASSRGGDDRPSANHGLSRDVGGVHGHDGEAARDDDPASRDQDRARDAVLRGAALPLTSVLPTVQAAVQGNVLDVKLRHLVSGTLVYDITVLSSDGRYRAIVVDARHNRILGMRQH